MAPWLQAPALAPQPCSQLSFLCPESSHLVNVLYPSNQGISPSTTSLNKSIIFYSDLLVSPHFSLYTLAYPCYNISPFYHWVFKSSTFPGHLPNNSFLKINIRYHLDIISPFLFLLFQTIIHHTFLLLISFLLEFLLIFLLSSKVKNNQKMPYLFTLKITHLLIQAILCHVSFLSTTATNTCSPTLDIRTHPTNMSYFIAAEATGDIFCFYRPNLPFTFGHPFSQKLVQNCMVSFSYHPSLPIAAIRRSSKFALIISILSFISSIPTTKHFLNIR